MTYRAVIFDLFGTLIDVYSLTEYERVLSEMATVVGAAPEEFSRLWLETFDQRARGVLATTAANVEHVCRALDLQPSATAVAEAVRLRVEHTRRAFLPRPDALPTLGELKSRGHKLGLITDCSAEVPILWDDSPFASLFDVAVFSCAIGLRKPDAQIYRLACEALAVDAGRCLYVGDGGSHELTGASRVGMTPVLIRLSDEVERDAHRVDAEEWRGLAVSSLSEVLELV